MSDTTLINALQNYLGDNASIRIYKGAGQWHVITVKGDTEAQCSRPKLRDALAVTTNYLWENK